jgi:hypothetical protein
MNAFILKIPRLELDSLCLRMEVQSICILALRLKSRNVFIFKRRGIAEFEFSCALRLRKIQ